MTIYQIHTVRLFMLQSASTLAVYTKYRRVVQWTLTDNGRTDTEETRHHDWIHCAIHAERSDAVSV